MNKFCCHGALLAWQLQYFMNIGYLSNTVAMVTFTRFLLKITALIVIANWLDKIYYNALHMNEPSLNDSKSCDFQHFLNVYITQDTAECCMIPFCQPGAQLCQEQKQNQKRRRKIMSHVVRKPVFCHMRTTKTQISLHIRTVWSASLLFAA